MNETMEFLLANGYVVLFASVLAEQLGLPLPAAPVLLAAGALAGLGRFSLELVWPIAILASLVGDTLWFYLGKTRGVSILSLLCRISLEPETCVRKTKSAYSGRGANWLLFAKFVPGLSTIAPPMAGMFSVSPWRFIVLDAGGAGLWSGAYILAGWLFRDQLESVAAHLARLGAWSGAALLASVAIYIAARYLERRRVIRSLRIARIAPLELKRRLDAGDRIVVIDLRTEFEWRERRIPGSLVLTAEEIDSFVPTFPGSEIVLYCSCPSEIASAGAAIQMTRKGMKLIRPLEGGFYGWTGRGFPVEGLDAGATVAVAA